ncbi:MAG: methyltransferase domain-containing protein [Phycisphaerae bacterium]|nr:methyltransferase domain-containing protein [Phycisphaerae bacterium]
MNKTTLNDTCDSGTKDTTVQCPNCLGAGMCVFHAVGEVPGNSCLLLDSREEALAYPHGHLALGFCPVCGFISNTAFDPGVQTYSLGYEEQQSFSPRFRAFQTALIRRLIDAYGVRGKDVVEIGCGKGDFLIELCQAGGNRGVGIDPACEPDRMAGRTNGQVRFIPEYYSEGHACLPCDVLCCRHTLEHIHQTHAFIRQVRRALGDRPEALVFFEVPDVVRVLRDSAFWDVYYEHCSYFSLGSLARLFRANGFAIQELAKDFDNQYLLLAAHPTTDSNGSRFPEEDDLKQLENDVRQFTIAVRRRVDGWRTDLEHMRKQGRRAAIWGSGSKCVSFLSAVEAGNEIAAVVDINPHRHDRFLPGSGRIISPPADLPSYRPDLVIVMNPIYLDEVACDIRAMGMDCRITAV